VHTTSFSDTADPERQRRGRRAKAAAETARPRTSGRQHPAEAARPQHVHQGPGVDVYSRQKQPGLEHLNGNSQALMESSRPCEWRAACPPDGDDGREGVVETTERELLRVEDDYCEVREVITTTRTIVRKIPRPAAAAGSAPGAHGAGVPAAPFSAVPGIGAVPMLPPSATMLPHQTMGGVRIVSAARSFVHQSHEGGCNTAADRERFAGKPSPRLCP
jgi:hypothetical protein